VFRGCPTGVLVVVVGFDVMHGTAHNTEPTSHNYSAAGEITE